MNLLWWEKCQWNWKSLHLFLMFDSFCISWGNVWIVISLFLEQYIKNQLM